MKNFGLLLMLFIFNDLFLLWGIKPYLIQTPQSTPVAIIATGSTVVVDSGIVQQDTGKEYLICDRVCSGNDDLVQYAREKTKDMDFILTITQESHWNWNSTGSKGEQGLIQRTRDTASKREFLDSDAFKNPNRQVDRAWEDRQRWIPYPQVIKVQQVGYASRMKRKEFFHIEYK